MENRVKRLKRTCKLRRKIQNLVDSENYEELMRLHEIIYDVTQPIPPDDDFPGKFEIFFYIISSKVFSSNVFNDKG